MNKILQLLIFCICSAAAHAQIKFDFVPGETILYFDNFEKDNMGETPMGWLTTRSVEVVTIEGLEGNWLKMDAKSAAHITRNKKQSWGNNDGPETKKPLTLQNFDNVHCEYLSVMDLGIYKITSSCSNLTGEFEFGGIKINIKDYMEIDKFSWTPIVGIGKSVGLMGLERNVTVDGLIEGDNTGVTNVDVKATVNSGVCTPGKRILGGQKLLIRNLNS